tara:strand:- start:1333 stop:1458 length:126 start_codon:yes stop_codon:yes gene_type:complete
MIKKIFILISYFALIIVKLFSPKKLKNYKKVNSLKDLEKEI